jgi:four helix bundle protein
MALPHFDKYRFEDLDVWMLSMQIVGEAYRMVQKFPRTEIFALADQLKRAATSIALNIAEGSGQQTTKGFILYLNHSKSSVLECVACLKIAEQEKWITSSETKIGSDLLREEYFKLIALVKSLSKRNTMKQK